MTKSQVPYTHSTLCSSKEWEIESHYWEMDKQIVVCDYDEVFSCSKKHP